MTNKISQAAIRIAEAQRRQRDEDAKRTPFERERDEVYAERFARLQAHLEDVTGHDSTVPGSDRHGRFVVYSVSTRDSNISLTRCSSRERAQVVAEADIASGFQPHSLFDLAELEEREDIERDERLPVCYALAAVKTIVVFNTVAS